MHLLLCSALGFSFLFNSCDNKAAQATSMEELPADFKDFYKRFHQDSAYQMNHIIFPLQGKPNNAIKGKDYSDFRWHKSDWVLHKNLGSLLDSYRKVYTVDSTYITEQIYHKTGTYMIERRFSKMAGKWYLVYYAGLTRLKPVMKDVRYQ